MQGSEAVQTRDPQETVQVQPLLSGGWRLPVWLKALQLRQKQAKTMALHMRVGCVPANTQENYSNHHSSSAAKSRSFVDKQRLLHDSPCLCSC